MNVGWRLAEEIAWARPERPGPEWWTLLDIAQDARDDTRQGMPGHGYLTARGKCSERTMYRRLKALTDAGLIKVVRKSAPDVRAIYEVTIIHVTPATNADMRSPVDNHPGSPVDNPLTPATNADMRYSPRRLTETAPTPDRNRATPDSVSGHHSVTYPVTTHPSTEALDLDASPVEGARARPGQAPMSSIERAAYQAAAGRLRRERQETQ